MKCTVVDVLQHRISFYSNYSSSIADFVPYTLRLADYAVEYSNLSLEGLNEGVPVIVDSGHKTT